MDMELLDMMATRNSRKQLEEAQAAEQKPEVRTSSAPKAHRRLPLCHH